jgi:hypothetical protein
MAAVIVDSVPLEPQSLKIIIRNTNTMDSGTREAKAKDSAISDGNRLQC